MHTIAIFENELPLLGKFKLFIAYCIAFCLALQPVFAQSGCPNCLTNLPSSLSADTIYLQSIPNGTKGSAYNEDISFRMPKTTTPVAANDSTIPSGLSISKLEIIGVENLPPGLYWEPNQFVFQTATQTDGCIKICGTPTQADTFILLVKLKATIFVVTQETSFPMRFIIEPSSSTTDGFAMTNFLGCGSTTVNFINNLPSNGNTGYSYQWNFGDGTSFIGENPPAHTYQQAGIYPVNYQALIDTAGFTLATVNVQSVTCVDQLGVGSPDLYAKLLDQNGALLLTSTESTNAALPLSIFMGIHLTSGNYTLEIWDEDSGLKGSDDLCGSVSFNYLSNDTLVSGGFSIALNIQNPITEVLSIDTVIVYPSPIAPTAFATAGTETCEGSDSLILSSNVSGGNQWFRNGQSIADANDFIYKPTQSGYYQVQSSNSYGCTAISDSLQLVFYPLPFQPVFYNNNNRLIIADTFVLPINYALQWYEYSAPISGETDLQYCSNHTAEYGLQVTDLTTGCSSFYSQNIVNNPIYDCTIGTNEVRKIGFNLSPNPTKDRIKIRFDYILPVGGTSLEVFDLQGKRMLQSNLKTNDQTLDIDCSTWVDGIYFAKIGAMVSKFVVVR
jgi:PKD repeat protein